MAKKNPEPEGTRQSIRLTAIRLFMENGVYATSLADIAAGAKLSKGTLYYHYPAKEDLVMDIAEEHFLKMTALLYNWVDSISVSTAAKDALSLLLSVLKRDDEQLKLYFAIMSEALRDEGGLRARMAEKTREWAMLIELGALKMTGRDSERMRKFSRSALAIIDGLTLHMLINPENDIDIVLELLGP